MITLGLSTMPNKNYIRGRKREYKAIETLKKLGCRVCFRSAGSHSEVDVIGIHEQTKRIFLIQCKPDSLSTNKRNEIVERNKLLNNEYLVTFEVI